jgi:hypothetical protein
MEGVVCRAVYGKFGDFPGIFLFPSAPLLSFASFALDGFVLLAPIYTFTKLYTDVCTLSRAYFFSFRSGLLVRLRSRLRERSGLLLLVGLRSFLLRE